MAVMYILSGLSLLTCILLTPALSMVSSTDPKKKADSTNLFISGTVFFYLLFLVLIYYMFITRGCF